jgi:hypothetical protein
MLEAAKVMLLNLGEVWQIEVVPYGMLSSDEATLNFDLVLNSLGCVMLQGLRRTREMALRRR